MDDCTMADKRAPRIQLPVLIDDAGLSPYGFRLYAHIKRRAGEDGSCFEGTRSIAEVCRMSVGQVSKAKLELKAAGLITMGKRATKGGMVDEMWIVDVWAENAAKYPSSVHCMNTNDTVQNTNTNQQTVQQVNTSTVSVHHTNTKEQETPVSVHTVNDSVHTVNDSVHTVNVRRSIEETIREDAPQVATTPPAPVSKPKKPKPTDPNQSHPAVIAFYEKTARRPNKEQAHLIASRVEDVDRWQGTMTYWLQHGWSAQNIGGMVNRYERLDDRIPATPVKPHQNGHANGHTPGYATYQLPDEPVDRISDEEAKAGLLAIQQGRFKR